MPPRYEWRLREKGRLDPSWKVQLARFYVSRVADDEIGRFPLACRLMTRNGMMRGATDDLCGGGVLRLETQVESDASCENARSVRARTTGVGGAD